MSAQATSVTTSKDRLILLGLVALFSSIVLVNGVLQLATERRIYGSVYELEKTDVTYFLFDDPDNLTLIESRTSSNTLVGTSYFSLCRKDNDTILHEVSFNADFSAITNITLHPASFLNGYFPNYYLASNGSHFWTLSFLTEFNYQLICFTPQAVVNTSILAANLSSDHYFPIMALRYWDQHLYVYGRNVTASDAWYIYIAGLNLHTLKYDFTIADTSILPKTYSHFGDEYGFDIDDQGNVWVMIELWKPVREGSQSIGIEIYAYSSLTWDVLSKIKIGEYWNLLAWLPRDQVEAKWITTYEDLDWDSDGSMSVDGQQRKILVPFTYALYFGHDYWVDNVFMGIEVFSYNKIPFPWLETVFWGGGIIVPLFLIMILIRDSRANFLQKVKHLLVRRK